MKAGDLPAARKLWKKSDGVELAEGDSPAELRAFLLRNPDTSFAAFERGRLVGAVLAGHDGRRGLLYHLAVAEPHQGAGVGRELVTRALEALREAKISRVLILVARDNRKGRAFWKRCGWKSIKGAKAYGLNL